MSIAAPGTASPSWPIARPDDPRFSAVSDLLARWPAGPLPTVAVLQAALSELLAAHRLSLVEAPAVPRRRKKWRSEGGAGMAPFEPRSIYEIRIAETGEIATRPDNLHDVCNALSWAAFPRAKWALTCRIAELQRARMSADGSQPGTRTREHDRLALLDEGGLIELGGEAPDVAPDLAPGGVGRGVVVGHALWQHAALGHPGVRAAVVRLPSPPSLDWARASCAEVRAAIDEAWFHLVRSPDSLHAAMEARAGEPIEPARLWSP